MNGILATDQARDSLGLNEERRAILQAADRFGRKELYPLARRMDDEEWWPDHIFPRMAEAGLLGASIAEEFGGAGLDLFGAGLIVQGFARWNHALALSYAAHDNLCANNLFHNASDAQRRKYLPGLCAGTLIGCLGLTEPGAGSDALGSMKTTARREGDDYILNGSKLYITNGPIADIVLAYAKTDPSRGSKGISAFIVETSSPGFKVAQKLVKMGYRGSQTGELVFDECRVPKENLVGVENGGVAVVMSGLDIERAMIAPICLGIAERALDLSIEYANSRQQFGQTIGSFQMVQSMLADMYVTLETMRTFTYRVLEDAAQVKGGAAGRGAIHMLTAASVMYAANGLNSVLDKAVQIHGGTGYIWETEINRLYRSNKLLEIGAGTTEVRKMIIAGELLKNGIQNG